MANADDESNNFDLVNGVKKPFDLVTVGGRFRHHVTIKDFFRFILTQLPPN